MKIQYTILLGIFLVAGCASSKKMLQNGNYDALIEKSVKNLVKNPTSEDDATMLDKAYKLANERDQDRVKYLKMEGNPNSWDEILGLYSTLKNRQALVKKVLPLHIGSQTIQYDQVDYDAEIVDAKHKAADYYNAHGRQLMENHTKDAYRQAYNELRKAQDYSGGSYADLDQLIDQARDMGTSRVLIGVVNRTQVNLPPDFTESLIAVNPGELNSDWVQYFTRKPDQPVDFDYYIDIILLDIAVSPNQQKEKDGLEKKTVENGFEYALDSRGNVMKDTAGNDIKIKKYKDIQCTFIETRQTKDCTIGGEIDFLTANPETLLKKQPVGANSHFEHASARAVGDLDALSPEHRQMINRKPIPFPDDVSMILDCSDQLRKSIHDALLYNRGVLR